MSKMNLYSVYDKASQTFNSPLCMVSDAVALRSLRETLRDQTTILARYPEDYSLVKVAEFDPETGVIIPASDVILDSFKALCAGAGVELSGGGTPEKPQSAPKTPENGVNRVESSVDAPAERA